MQDRQTSQPTPERRHLGGDDWLTPFAQPSPWAFRIDSGHPKIGWQAHRPATTTTPEYPGTALDYEGSLWEIVDYRITAKQPPRHCYFLRAWPAAEAPRAVHAYSPEVAEQHVADRRAEATQSQKRAATFWISPLLSLLPAEDQLRLERELDHPAVGATRWTGLAEAVLGVASLMFSVWALASPEASPLARDLAPHLRLLGGFGLIEGMLRFASASLQDQPLGSLPVALPILLTRAIRDARSPERRRREGPRYGVRAATDHRFLSARDEVRHLPATAPGEAPRIEILSILPKPHWTLNRTGVRIGEHWFLPVERQVLGDEAEGDGSAKRRTPQPPLEDHRHRFVLEQVVGDTMLAQHVEYHPEEVQELWLDRQRMSARTRVETFRQFWGLLDPADQHRLQTVYGYDPYRNTMTSIYFGGALAALALFVALSNLLSGRASVAVDGVILLLAVAVLADAVRRYSKRDQAAGDTTRNLSPDVAPAGDTPTLHGSTSEEPDEPLEVAPGSWFAPFFRLLARPMIELPTNEEWRAIAQASAATPPSSNAAPHSTPTPATTTESP